MEAMVCIGSIYETGIGAKLEISSALSWYQKAAEKGSSNAMSKLAHLYENGIGVEQDPAKAKKWHVRSQAIADSSA